MLTLVGFMAAGKSTIGRLLAERLDIRFVDTDRALETAFGLSVGEIFDQLGEPAFRAAERELILRLLGGEPQVLSLGGGAYADATVRQAVNARAIAIWIDPPFDAIVERIGRSRARPLACGRSAEQLKLLWDERRTSYAAAHIHVPTSDAAPARFVDAIIAQLDQLET
ncbi:MAG: shikimate kinase [Sphingomicrobium sp.]